MPRAGNVDAFETKRGWCVVEDDGLRLQGSTFGYLRNLYGGYWQRGSRRQRLLFAVTAVGLPLGIVGAVLSGPSLPALAVALAAYLAFAAYQRVVRGFSADDWIPLSAIEDVRAVSGSTGLTRPRLVVRYRAAGNERRRYVMLPSRHLPGRGDALERAVALLRERGVPVEGA